MSSSSSYSGRHAPTTTSSFRFRRMTSPPLLSFPVLVLPSMAVTYLPSKPSMMPV